jgi:hypothetical protein
LTAAAEERAAEYEEEIEQLRASLENAIGRAERAEQTRGGGGGRGGASPGGAASSAELEQLSTKLIEAKMAEAQNAFERDEARADAKRLREELSRVGGGTRKLGQHATKLEVRSP